ncbi:hypothetical protein LX36DRAFT_71035 [Colletotrichum falcatum]|nr:hypothetical protein LX36DRAFT_71035 [Colletotrichum falcatum]
MQKHRFRTCPSAVCQQPTTVSLEARWNGTVGAGLVGTKYPLRLFVSGAVAMDHCRLLVRRAVPDISPRIRTLDIPGEATRRQETGRFRSFISGPVHRYRVSLETVRHSVIKGVLYAMERSMGLGRRHPKDDGWGGEGIKDGSTKVMRSFTL